MKHFTFFKKLSLCALLVWPTFGLAQQFGANDADFLNLVGEVEAPAGFSDVYDLAPFGPPRPIEDLTIAEVLRYQESIREAGTKSSAVGRYQFIYDTLIWVVNDLGIDRSIVFDSEVQTLLARHLMYRCGFYDPEKPVGPLGNCLASRWAALPLLTGPQVGQSVYRGVDDNKALVDPRLVRVVLGNRFRW